MQFAHLILSVLVAMGVAYLMIGAGIGKRALEPKRGRRICPSCGRALRDCCCRD